ncbi:hypothetical protein [Streptomyces sp. NEAU-NA10]|uniref:hypothetical protein n=1 Tax=Streptomyces sp. NEAU-NA10 TaxID=3416050 RepID=UPI003CC5C704
MPRTLTPATGPHPAFFLLIDADLVLFPAQRAVRAAFQRRLDSGFTANGLARAHVRTPARDQQPRLRLAQKRTPPHNHPLGTKPVRD